MNSPDCSECLATLLSVWTESHRVRVPYPLSPVRVCYPSQARVQRSAEVLRIL